MNGVERERERNVVGTILFLSHLLSSVDYRRLSQREYAFLPVFG